MAELKMKDGWLRMPSEVTENTVFPTSVKDSPLKVDFKQLKALNSYGVRSFIQFTREHAARGLEYHNCPPHFVELMSVVRDLLGPARDGRIVQSVVLPYCCASCRKTVEQIHPVASLAFDEKGFGQPAPVCGSCGDATDLDVDESDYLDFLR